MPGDDVQLNREIAIATDAGDGAFMLLELRVSEELGRLFRIEAVVRAQRANINLDTLLGTNATARVTVKQGVERYFNGIISRISRSGEKNTELDYTIVIVPQIWLATRTTDCSIAQNLTVPAIVKQYLEHYDVVVDDQLKGTYRSWEYCVQYRESDFNFISRLMEQEGISYFFKHENGAHKMVLCDDPLSHKPIPNVPEVEFFPPNPDMPAPANTLSDWNFDADLESAGVALNDFDFKAPTKNLVTTRGVEVPGIAKNSSVFDHPGEYTEVADGEIQARVRAEEIAAHALGWSGSGTCRDIYAGGTFKLKDPREVLREADRGEYLVIASTLIAIQNLDESGSGGGGSVSCSLRAVKSDRPFRPNRSTPKPVIPGPQTAMVVGPDGQELQVDEFGRVRVRFMWDRYGTEKPEDSSAWIRVSQPWAGKSYGAMFIPRAGHEVIVEFLEGDPDRPIITGRVYNFDNKVPYALPANKTISTIRTDSSPHSGGYHEIRFEDKDGSEQLMIHAQRRMDLTVKASLYESAYGNREEIVGYEDKGDHNTTVCGDTNDHRKKGTFYKIEKVVNKTVVEDVVEDFQKTQTTKVAERYTLNAKEIVEESSDKLSLKSGKVTVQGSSGVHLKAGDICIEGTQSINLKSGGNFVVIDAAGVTIKGSTVMINSGGSAKAADGPESAADATIEEPFDAYAATTAVPGSASGWGGGGSPRSPTTRTVRMVHAPNPPPPPTPGTIDRGPTGTADEIELVEVVEVTGTKAAGTPTAPTEARRQYINLNRTVSGNQVKENGRAIFIKAKIRWRDSAKTDSLAGKKVRFYNVPDGGNRAAAQLKDTLRCGFDGPNIADVKVETTQADGWTPVIEFHTSRFGGDIFNLKATLETTNTGGLDAGTYTVWRKILYEVDNMARPGGGSYADISNGIQNDLIAKHAGVFNEVVAVGQDSTPAHRRVHDTNDAITFANNCAQGGGNNYFHLVYVDTITMGTEDKSISFNNFTSGPPANRLTGSIPARDAEFFANEPAWIRPATWVDANDATRTGTIPAAKFSTPRSTGEYARPVSEGGDYDRWEFDFDLGGTGINNGDTVNITINYRCRNMLSGVQTGQSTTVGMRFRERRRRENNAFDVANATLQTSVHESTHAFGLASTKLPTGAANPAIDGSNAHCTFNATCVMTPALHEHTDMCPRCQENVRARNLATLPVDTDAAM